jgi:cell division protein FtsZ
VKKTQVIEEELVFEKKTIESDEVAPEKKGSDIDPFNDSIEESLVRRADERRKKLKDFNYKFHNNLSKIEEIEKQPAYKRMGIELENKESKNNVSRMSLGTDSNDEIQLRSNNSFLHDNVD